MASIVLLHKVPAMWEVECKGDGGKNPDFSSDFDWKRGPSSPTKTPLRAETLWLPMGDGGGGACVRLRSVCHRALPQRHIRERCVYTPRYAGFLHEILGARDVMDANDSAPQKLCSPETEGQRTAFRHFTADRYLSTDGTNEQSFYGAQSFASITS